MAAKPKPQPAPPPSTKTEQQIAGTGGSTIDPALLQAAGSSDPNVSGPAIQQIMAQSGKSDAVGTATQQYLDSLGIPVVTPEMALHGTEPPAGNRQQAVADWQAQLSAAGLLPSGYTRGYLDQPTINATYQVMAFGTANKLASPSDALNALHASYQAVATSSTADPALIKAEQDLRRAQLPLDWADLQRRIKEQPLLDAELQRRLADEKALPQQEAQAVQKIAHDDWWVPLSDQAATDWGTRIAQGKSTEAEFTTWAQGQAAALYPTLASFINNGAKTATLLDPYAQLAAHELDKAAPDLQGNMRYFNPSMLTGADGSLVNTNDYLVKLRQMPEWRTTTSANELANDWSAKLAQTFGGVSGLSTGPLTAP